MISSPLAQLHNFLLQTYHFSQAHPEFHASFTVLGTCEYRGEQDKVPNLMDFYYRKETNLKRNQMN